MNVSQALATEFDSHKTHPFFVSFLVSDNNSNSDDGSIQKSPLEMNLNSTREILRFQPFRFLCEIIHNKTLKEFIETYLASRTKPFQRGKIAKTSADSLMPLDINVFLIFSRIATTVRNEIPTIIAQMPKNSKLTIIPGGGSKKPSNEQTCEGNIDVKKRFQDQFIILIANVPTFLRFPYILDLVSIIGESNIHASTQLLKDLFAVRPALLKELSASLLETFQTVSQLFTMMQTLYRSLSGSSESSKKGKQSSGANKKSGSKSEQAQAPEQQVEFFFAFAADIIFSICCFLESASTLLHETCLYSFQDDTFLLSKQYGASLFNMLRSVYEVALPTALKADGLLRKQQHSVKRDGAPETVESDSENKSTQVNIIKMKSLKCLKVMLSVTLSMAREGAQGQGSSSSRSSEGVSWMDILQSNVDIGADESAIGAGMQGSFISDFILLYGSQDLEAIVRHSFGGDLTDVHCSEGEYDYILESFKVKESLLQVEHRSQVKHGEVVLSNRKESAALGLGSKINEPAGPNLTREQSVAAIRGVVPDLGEGFVEACLDIYNGNVELVIDALFADDLHPALKALDRRMQKVWIGKQDKEPEFLQKPGHPSASASASASSRSITKERVRLMERKQEWDSYILSKEYDDDYDDQFDENIANRKMEDDFRDCLESAIQGQRAGSGKRTVARPITDLDKQIAETRRLNSLIREEEQEIMFWESMRNTNRVEGNRLANKNSWRQSTPEDVNDGDEAEQDHSTAHPLSKQNDISANASHRSNSSSNNQQKKATSNSNPKPNPTSHKPKPNEDSGTGQRKQNRAKAFDSHHQKDRAMRKMGTFS